MNEKQLIKLIEKAAKDGVTELNLSGRGITKLPASIEQLSHLTTLDLEGNLLSSLPAEIGTLTNLTTLNLFDNELSSLPAEIGKLTNLSSLNLRGNNLSSLPTQIGQLINLTMLSLRSNRLDSLPGQIGQLTNLRELNLWSNKLSSLPAQIGQLANLTTLDLAYNQLLSLPVEIGQLTNLTQFDLYYNKLSSLPPQIGELTNLTLLELYNNKLSSLPAEIGQLTNLTQLDLYNNKLSSLPAEIEQLTNLTLLDLRYNSLPIRNRILQRINAPDTIIGYYLHGDPTVLQIIEETIKNRVTELNLSNKDIAHLPSKIGQLTNLTTLYLGYNKLLSLRPEVGLLTSLTTLGLGYNELSSLPPEVGQLTNLTTLDLRYNELLSLPPEVGQLTNLTTLDLRYNELLSLPPEVGQLTNLTTLYLRSNRLSGLPTEIGQLSNLTTLNLLNNRLSRLAVEIGQLSNLTTLDLSGNQLENLPTEIGQLTNLTTLDLGYNKLSSLPPEIGELTNLVTLDLRYNKLSSLPPEIGELTNLVTLDLRENPLPIPPEILQRTKEPAVILDYYARESRKPLNEGKLVLVGEGRVGKTSLVKRLVEKEFNPNESITEGIAIKNWKVMVDEAEIKLNIWDFGGQEIMHATHQFFLTLRSLYVLVLDLQQDEASNRLDYWLKLIESFGADSPIIVVSNQIDQARKLYLNQGELRTKYPQIKAFVNTSCKTGQGLADLEWEIRRLIGSLAHVRDEIPLEWLAIKSQLQGLGKDYVAYDDYVALCQVNDVSKEREQRTLIRLLHDLGVILNFQDDSRLSETSVLNPAWVTGGVYQIINAKQIAQNRGILEIGQLDEILDRARYPKEMDWFIILMMRKFELCFDLEGRVGEKFLIPDLLPTQEPVIFWPPDSLEFEYHYSFLPSSILSRFMVQMHGLIFGDQYCWRTGMLLVHNRTHAKVRSEEKMISISVMGEVRERRQFLTEIRQRFEQIHQRFSNLNVVEHICYAGQSISCRELQELREEQVRYHDLFDANSQVITVDVEELLERFSKESTQKGDWQIKKLLKKFRDQLHPELFYNPAFSLGKVSYLAGKYSLARQALAVAHQVTQTWRGMEQADEQQVKLSRQSAKLYSMLVDCCVQERNEPKAFEYAAVGKGRAFVNKLTIARLNVGRMRNQDGFGKKLERAGQLRYQIKTLRQKTISQDHHKRGRLFKLLQQEIKLWNKIERRYPVLTATLKVPTLSARQARALAKELDATLVEYYRHASGWCAFVVTGDKIRYVPLPKLDDKLLKHLANWRNYVHRYVGRTPRRHRWLEKLYEAVVAPLRLEELESNSRRVILAPFRELHLLPLAAAYDGLKACYLAEEYVISYTPSLTALYVVSQEQKRRHSSQAFERLLSVVYPGVPASADYLPNVLEEAEAIAARLSGVAQVDTLREQEATPDEVLRRAPEYDVIHFGCHGRFDSQNPHESGLMLAQKPLTVAQIITQLNLKRTRLTTLAACLTGEVALREGEEHVGLLQAMMTAGVQTVVASLWPVDDAATRALFEAFYTRQATLNAPAEAMRDACQLLRNQQAWQHPYYWAAFAVNGLVPPRQERINDTIWPPTDLSEQIEQYTRERTRERNQMRAYQPMPEAKLLLGDLLDERQEVLQALKQHPLSKEAAAQRIPTGELGVAYALHLLVQDNPALQEFIGQEMADLNAWSDFVELVENSRLERSVGAKEHQDGQILTSESVKSTQMDNSISDFRDHFMSVLEQEPPAEEEKKGLVKRVFEWLLS